MTTFSDHDNSSVFYQSEPNHLPNVIIFWMKHISAVHANPICIEVTGIKPKRTETTNLPVSADRRPSCLQITLASLLSHLLSHSCPHLSLLQTSTLPSLTLRPPSSLTLPLTYPHACGSVPAAQASLLLAIPPKFCKYKAHLLPSVILLQSELLSMQLFRCS